MQTDEHAFRVGLFREHPELAPLLLRMPLQTPLPPYSKIEVADATFAQHRPTEYRADVLILLEDAESRPQLSIIVEVQSKPDPDKEGVWPFYLASVFKERRCPAVLLVLAQDQRTASWASRPIELGPGGSRIVPQVVGSHQVPRVETREEALQMPALAVLSAVAHAAEPDAAQVVLSGVEALRGGTFAADSVRFLNDLIRSKMNDAARQALDKLEKQMKIDGYEYQSDFARQYVAEGEVKGKAEGEAKLILRTLERRKIAVSPDQVEHIRSCRDESQLLTWFDRALTARSISDVLDP
jgi:hypothetical protein